MSSLVVLCREGSFGTVESSPQGPAPAADETLGRDGWVSHHFPDSAESPATAVNDGDVARRQSFSRVSSYASLQQDSWAPPEQPEWLSKMAARAHARGGRSRPGSRAGSRRSSAVSYAPNGSNGAPHQPPRLSLHTALLSGTLPSPSPLRHRAAQVGQWPCCVDRLSRGQKGPNC
jgi:hypothetical protein